MPRQRFQTRTLHCLLLFNSESQLVLGHRQGPVGSGRDGPNQNLLPSHRIPALSSTLSPPRSPQSLRLLTTAPRRRFKLLLEVYVAPMVMAFRSILWIRYSFTPTPRPRSLSWDIPNASLHPDLRPSHALCLEWDCFTRAWNPSGHGASDTFPEASRPSYL